MQRGSGMGLHGGLRGIVKLPMKNPRSPRSLLKRVLFYAGPYRWLMVGMLLLDPGQHRLGPVVATDHAGSDRPCHSLQGYPAADPAGSGDAGDPDREWCP